MNIEFRSCRVLLLRNEKEIERKTREPLDGSMWLCDGKADCLQKHGTNCADTAVCQHKSCSCAE